ncbi:MAG: extracellular solute-binding protein [Chloroflexi bacterium]|nr:extracellular solute-binding protein [Chloroflexota bacterium]
MSKSPKITRRDFIRKAGAAAAGAALAAKAPGLASAAVSKPFEMPYIKRQRTVRIAVGGWAEQNMRDLLAQTDFTQQTGIDVEVVLRSDVKETELTKIVGAVQAGTSPYDVIDFEDELTTTLSQANYVIGLDDILPDEMWEDFSPEMIAYSDVWSKYNGETFRVIHNWEMPIWWYRKDWFDERGVEVPTTWEEVAAMGEVFTDQETGVWATEDGLVKGAFLNVYLAWITLQAGGNPFDTGDEYRTALQYVYDLMHTHNTLNPASLQKDYNQQNADYAADKVAFMRQWPFFGDFVRSDENAEWFTEDKAMIGLPPVGPGGPSVSTYPAAWGFGILRTSPNIDEAKELVSWLATNEIAVKSMEVGFWFLNARKSVLAAAPQDNWLVKQLQMYTDAGVIGVRPFHPRFVEALTVIEDNASAYLTNQMDLDDTLDQTRAQLEELE